MGKFADVIVVGGGIVGLSTGWRLAQEGLSVTVLDASRGAASFAGAGMLAPGGEVFGRSGWSDFAVESLHMYSRFVAELREETGCAIDYRECGAFEIAFSEDEMAELARRAEVQQALGIPSRAVDAYAVSVAAPLAAPWVYGARYFPEDAMVNPQDVMKALRRACSARGVRHLQGETVWSIQAADRVRVRASGGEFEGSRAILSAGAWSGEIDVMVDGAPYGLPASVPVRGHLVIYRLEPESLVPIVRNGHTYILQRVGGVTVAGSTTERVGFDRLLSSRMVEDIASRTERLLPALTRGRIYTAWLGFRPGTADDDLVLRRAGESNLWLAYGHYRNGILLAPATAKKLLKEIAGTGKPSFACRTVKQIV